MFEIFKRILTSPSLEFRTIGHKTTIRQAALVVLVSGLTRQIYLWASFKPATAIGVILVASYDLVVWLGIWAVLGWLAHLFATQVLKCDGDRKDLLIGFGYAYILFVLSNVVVAFLTPMKIEAAPFVIFLFGWFVVLLVIALREMYDMATLHSVMSVAIAGMVSLIAKSIIMMPIIDLLPLADPNPFAREKAAATYDHDPPACINLIANPGFEQVDEKGEIENMPLRWQGKFPQMTLGGAALALDPDTPCFGNYSARSDLPGIRRYVTLVWGQEIGRWFFAPAVIRTPSGPVATMFLPADAFAETNVVHVSLWLKTEAAGAVQARLLAAVPDKKGKQRGMLVLATPAVKDTTPWTQYRVKAAWPKGTQGARLEIYHWGCGTVWVDDVKVYVKPGRGPQETLRSPAPAQATERPSPDD
ncbi:MAG: Yip1 family protein [Alphaproteobacteria bacterium]